jgi:hypothetical protein
VGDGANAAERSSATRIDVGPDSTADRRSLVTRIIAVSVE